MRIDALCSPATEPGLDSLHPAGNIGDSVASQPSTYDHYLPHHLGSFENNYHDTQGTWKDSHPQTLLDPPTVYPLVGTVGCNPTYQVDDGGIDNMHHRAFQATTPEDVDWNIFRSSRIDWLGCETDLSDRQTLPPDELTPDDTHTSETSQQVGIGINMVNDTSLVLDICRSYQTAQPSNDRDGKETWPGVLDRGGNEAWPFDYTSNKGFRRIKLPPLRQVLEQTVGNRPAIEKSTLMDLIKILSAPQIPLLNDGPSLEALPAVTFLGQFIKIYFAEFHPVLPVIHKPTWRIEKCSTALLAAMACIGATYSTAEGSQEVSALLAEITQRALFWIVSSVDAQDIQSAD